MHLHEITFIELSLLLLLAVVIFVHLSQKLRLPVEVLLILGSAALSLIPGLPSPRLDPELVFLVFLPPILFGAAYFTSWRDFKANLRPISLLAIGLVLFNTLAVGLTLNWLLPEVPLSVAFLFGAIVAPPDASAATAITKKLGVPRRLLTIIEGESLINNSTALIAYRFSIAAILSGTFSFSHAMTQFFWLASLGILVGLGLAWLGFHLLKRLEDRNAQTVVSLLTSFACYAVSERLGVSAVLATVAGGLYFGRMIPSLNLPELRVDAEAGWKLILFLINGLVFTLIGLQLPHIIHDLKESYWITELTLVAILLSLTVILVRFLWVFPATYLPRWIFKSLAKKDPSPSPKVVILLAWTGMRGIVSLAAALALPEFPHRSLLVFLTYWVILTTLILPTLTLPSLMKWLKIKPGKENETEETQTRLELTRATLKTLNLLREKKIYPVELIELHEKRLERKLQTLESNIQEESAFSPLFSEEQIHRRFLKDLLENERKTLLNIRQQAKIHDEVFHILSRELDLEELRLKTTRV